MDEEQKEQLSFYSKELEKLFVILGNAADELQNLNYSFQYDDALNKTEPPDVPDFDGMLELIEEATSLANDAADKAEEASVAFSKCREEKS